MNENVNKLYTDIGQQALEYIADQDWSMIRVYYASTGQVGTGEFVVTNEVGVTERVEGPEGWIRSMMDLKYEMFESGMGAWLSATANIARVPLGISFEFNFDEKPEWFGLEPSPEDYLIELHRFPRSNDQVPSWFPTE